MTARYQRYLESVLEVAEDYQEIQDLLARHATLQATNDHLRQHQQESAAEAEHIRVELQVCACEPHNVAVCTIVVHLAYHHFC